MQNQKLTADDLYIITQIISESYSIKRLELQDNDSLDYLNNLMKIGNNVKVESLSINKILFRYDSFRNLIRIIENNLRDIRFLEISNTLLFQEQLIELFTTIKLIKNLIVFILDYQSFQEKDEKVFDSLYSCQNCFLNLKHFSVRKSTLSISFYGFVQIIFVLIQLYLNYLKNLQDQQNQIQVEMLLIQKIFKCYAMDYFQIQVCQVQIGQLLFIIFISFKFIQKIWKSSKQLGQYENGKLIRMLESDKIKQYKFQCLNLKNCRLTDKSILQLIPCLHQNSSIKHIDISQNEISLRVLLQIDEVLGNNKTSIQTLKLQNLQIFWDVESIQNELNVSNLLNNLNYIDLSTNSKQNESIIKLLDHFIKIKTLDNLQILTLNNCGIMDDQCETLANFIYDNKIIKEVLLIQNNLTRQGFKLIFDPILQNKSSLITLNLSKNYIDEQYFKDLTDVNIIPLTYFRLLIIDGNQFKGHAQGITLIQ